jgi:hypothetical protein
MASKPTVQLTKRFLNGLADHNLTYEDIVQQGWRYCGGDRKHHQNYWKLTTRHMRPRPQSPDHTGFCVCGHHIVENCYICDKKMKRILVLGNCCIKRFIPKNSSGRSCNVCGQPHRNRVVDRCNKCRKGRCDVCGIYIDEKYKKCYKCNKAHRKKNTTHESCIECGGSGIVYVCDGFSRRCDCSGGDISGDKYGYFNHY